MQLLFQLSDLFASARSKSQKPFGISRCDKNATCFNTPVFSSY